MYTHSSYQTRGQTLSVHEAKAYFPHGEADLIWLYPVH